MGTKLNNVANIVKVKQQVYDTKFSITHFIVQVQNVYECICVYTIYT